jgi:hypothetical protein
MDTGTYRMARVTDPQASQYAAFGPQQAVYYIPRQPAGTYPHFFVVKVANADLTRPRHVTFTQYLLIAQAAPGAPWKAAPEPTDWRSGPASSMTSAISSDAPGTCRTSWTWTSVPVAASPGTAARSCLPLSAGTAPVSWPGSRVIAIVPPREKTSTRQEAGRAVATTGIPSLDTGKRGGGVPA